MRRNSAGETTPHDEPRDGLEPSLTAKSADLSNVLRRLTPNISKRSRRARLRSRRTEASPRRRCPRRARLRAAPAPRKSSKHILRRLTPNISKLRRRARLPLRRTESEPAPALRETGELRAGPAPRKSSQHISRRLTPNISTLRRRPRLPSRRTEGARSGAERCGRGRRPRKQPPRARPYWAHGRERAPPAPAERTAEIYVLRQPGPATALKIVPIRPESVELSRSERDAFRSREGARQPATQFAR